MQNLKQILEKRYGQHWPEHGLMGYRSIHWPILRQMFQNLKREIVVDDQRSWTNLEIFGGACFLAEMIEKRSSSKHVGIMLPTSGMFPMAFLACWILGRIPVPLNYLLSEEEQDYVIADSGIDTIITVRQMLDVLGYEPKGVGLIELDKEKKAFKGIPPFRIPPLSQGEDTAIMIYTSGTSGKPKGVMLSHSNLVSNAYASIISADIQEADTFCGVLPQFHSFGMMALTVIPLVLGSKVVYTARFNPKKIVDLIRDHGVKIFIAIPSMYNAIVGVKKAGPEDMKTLRLAGSGGEPLPDDVFNRFKDKYNVRINEGYGLTETSPIVCWNLPTDHREKSVGRLVPYQEVQIRGDNGEIMPRGEEGEIYIKGPNIMKGYYQLPELTAGVLDKDGWFKTGDWGLYDPDGFLFITGRVKEMLIISGENVFPREIEEILNRHPSVSASSVVGRPDSSRGEVPIAFIELEEGQDFDEQALRKWCRDNLAAFKAPKEVRVLEALPRNPTGKIMRRHLMEIIKSEMAEA